MSVVLSFIEFFSMLIVYHVLFIKDQVSLNRTIIMSLIWSTVASIIFYMFWTFSFWITIMVLIGITFITSIRYNKNFIMNIVEILISFLIIGITEMVIAVPLILISLKVELNESIYVVVLLLTMAVVIFLLKNKTKDWEIWSFEEYIYKYSNVIIILIDIAVFIFVVKIFAQKNNSIEIIIFGTSILFLSTIAMNTYYMVDLYKKGKERKKIEIKESINPLIQELIDEMKASEHEYKNHLNILYCMMQVCKQDELKDRAKKYIGDVFENSNVLNRVSEIDNTIIKAVLLSKINIADKKEIDFQYNIESELENIPLDDSELTVVLSNLLNNAIEAASESEVRKIQIETNKKHAKYIIKISNSVDNFDKDMIEKIKKVGVSTKGEGRGYGLYNINNIIRKYKGKMDIYLEDDMFNILIEI